MQLVRITHSRCQEWDGYNYVFAPDRWDADEVQRRVNKAIDTYLDALKRLKEDEKGMPYPRLGFVDFKSFPDKTVREVQEEHARKQQANRDWEAAHSGRNSGFDHYLRQQGFVSLYEDAAKDSLVDADADWGHMHGTPIKYDTTESPHVTPQSIVNKERGIHLGEGFYE